MTPSTPYNPTGRTEPFWLRTIVLVLLCAALAVAVAASAAALVGPGDAKLPREVYQPSYPVPAPGWWEPTQTPGALNSPHTKYR